MPKKRKKRVKKKQTRREKLTASTKKFKREVKKSISTAIIAAFGFIIALSWKDVITEYVNQVSSKSPVQGQIISALIVTVISVAGILIITRFFSVEE